MDTTVYECLECQKFFTKGYEWSVWLRDVPMEEITARRLQGERTRVFLCGECQGKLLRERPALWRP